jgi:hypothetical protein
VLKIAVAAPPLAELLAVFGAGASVIGGVIGVILDGLPVSRSSLENLALGTTIGGFAGCVTTFLVYLLIKTM